jgi:hypothetical protein
LGWQDDGNPEAYGGAGGTKIVVNGAGNMGVGASYLLGASCQTERLLGGASIRRSVAVIDFSNTARSAWGEAHAAGSTPDGIYGHNDLSHLRLRIRPGLEAT